MTQMPLITKCLDELLFVPLDRELLPVALRGKPLTRRKKEWVPLGAIISLCKRWVWVYEQASHHRSEWHRGGETKILEAEIRQTDREWVLDATISLCKLAIETDEKELV